MYEITEYSKLQAKKLGVQIKPSTRKGKKLDVFENNKKVAFNCILVVANFDA